MDVHGQMKTELIVWSITRTGQSKSQAAKAADRRVTQPLSRAKLSHLRAFRSKRSHFFVALGCKPDTLTLVYSCHLYSAATAAENQPALISSSLIVMEVWKVWVVPIYERRLPPLLSLEATEWMEGNEGNQKLFGKHFVTSA